MQKTPLWNVEFGIYRLYHWIFFLPLPCFRNRKRSEI